MATTQKEVLEDLYGILEVARDATSEEIRKSYRRLALKWHPDKNPGVDATQQFQKISEAYNTLSNPEEKRAYDAFLAEQDALANQNKQAKQNVSANQNRQENNQQENKVLSPSNIAPNFAFYLSGLGKKSSTQYMFDVVHRLQEKIKNKVLIAADDPDIEDIILRIENSPTTGLENQIVNPTAFDEKAVAGMNILHIVAASGSEKLLEAIEQSVYSAKNSSQRKEKLAELFKKQSFGEMGRKTPIEMAVNETIRDKLTQLCDKVSQEAQAIRRKKF